MEQFASILNNACTLMHTYNPPTYIDTHHSNMSHTHTHTHACQHMHARMHIHACMHTHEHIQPSHIHRYTPQQHVAHALMHTYNPPTYIDTHHSNMSHTHTCTHARMPHACTHACMHTCMHAPPPPPPHTHRRTHPPMCTRYICNQQGVI